jgi:cytidylate kinase
MPVVTISRGSHSHGREVAEKLAEKLGFKCVSREIILDASEHFNIPEMTLVRAVHDAPSVFERLTHGRRRYVAYVRESLLSFLQEDNIVYHGLAGHYFVGGISHVLKVRIIADFEDRVAEEMRREHLTAEEARKALIRDDDARYRWGHHLYGIDHTDPRLYDLGLHINTLTVEEAVEIIANAVKMPDFQPTPESRKALRLLYHAARIQSALLEEIPTVKVDVEDGEVVVFAKGHWAEGKQLIAKIDRLIDFEKERVRIKLKLTNS